MKKKHSHPGLDIFAKLGIKNIKLGSKTLSLEEIDSELKKMSKKSKKEKK